MSQSVLIFCLSLGNNIVLRFLCGFLKLWIKIREDIIQKKIVFIVEEDSDEEDASQSSK